MRFTIYEVPYQAEIDPENPDRSKPIGAAESRQQAETLASVFPGRGSCLVWDNEAKRVILSINHENKRSSN